MELTRSQELRVLARLEEEDLHRFEFNSRENVESIETTKRNLELLQPFGLKETVTDALHLIVQFFGVLVWFLVWNQIRKLKCIHERYLSAWIRLYCSTISTISAFGTESQVAIEGFPAYSVFLCQTTLTLTTVCASAQFLYLCRIEDRLTPLVFPSDASQRNSFPLSFEDDRPLKLGHGTDEREKKHCDW
jgi:hypothetical protein